MSEAVPHENRRLLVAIGRVLRLQYVAWRPRRTSGGDHSAGWRSFLRSAHAWRRTAMAWLGNQVGSRRSWHVYSAHGLGASDGEILAASLGRISADHHHGPCTSPRQLEPPSMAVLAELGSLELVHGDRTADRRDQSRTSPRAQLDLAAFLSAAGLDHTDTIAELIIQRCGSLQACLHRDARTLEVASGDAIAAALVVRAGQLLRTALQEQVDRGPMLANRLAMTNYLRFNMAHLESECLRVLYLDASMHLLADELTAQGAADHVAVDIRQIVFRGLQLRASGFLLVHNHPGGDCQPSPADIEATKRIVEAAALYGMVCHDHLIVARNQVTSFAKTGLL
jgi:DNA repair protein RadC